MFDFKEWNKTELFAAFLFVLVTYLLYDKLKSSKFCCQIPKSDPNQLKSLVKDSYSEKCRTFTSNDQTNANKLAQIFGYTEEELNNFGQDANMGLSCGNPVSQANLKPGETVLDLGCGGGFDLFLAMKKIGEHGKGIGIDMSEIMIERAKQNAIKRNIKNIQFYLCEIEKMPLLNNSIDCVISNCVLNLVPNKLLAYQEIYRVIKLNGRLVISDIVLKKHLPERFDNDLMMFITGYVSCVSGAILFSDYEDILKKVGFREIKFVMKKVDLNVWKGEFEENISKKMSCCGDNNTNTSTKENGNTNFGCCGSNLKLTEQDKKRIGDLLKDVDINEYIGSYYIFAVK